MQIINIEQKEEWAKNRTLWNAMMNFLPRRVVIFKRSELLSIVKIRRKPFESNTSYAVEIKFVKENGVINGVKCFRKINKDTLTVLNLLFRAVDTLSTN